jgi:hypothetical protein
MSNSYITITPLTAYTGNANAQSALGDHRYSKILLNLIGNATYNQSGSGGWQVVDRPKMVAATQWYDRSPFQLQFEAVLDNGNSNVGSTHVVSSSTQVYDQYNDTKTFQIDQVFLNSTANSSVEDSCIALESWMDKVTGMLTPPILKLEGPIPGTQRYWVLYNLEFTEAVRDRDTGDRIQQNCKITLYEFQPPYANQNEYFSYSPTQQWTLTNIATNSSTTYNSQYVVYQVKKGDTINSISIHFYGDASYAAKILSINNIRDPKSIKAGQRLKVIVF